MSQLSGNRKSGCLSYLSSAVPGKRGRISGPVNQTLRQMGQDEVSWRLGMRLFGTRRYAVVGPIDRIRQFANAIGRKWLHGLEENRAIFTEA